MCGIAGIYSLGHKQVSFEIIRRMLERIYHRGPDESGIYVNDTIGLGSVRLSIVDLLTGQQPISTPDKNYWIVHNGEIYNHPELRKALVNKGVTFSTKSDTEVILRYYEMYGEKCLDYFNGQFAFAIWDKSKKELFIARDRFGIRPLFYTQQDNHFIFASEIKSILEYPGIKTDLDAEALLQVFTFWSTLSPATVFKNIFELPPAHYLKIRNQKIEIKRYWDLQFPENNVDYLINIKSVSEELDNLLEDAVSLRLRADVPVAAYLSGGIDSAATTHYIKKVAHNKLRTFSIGFENKEFDETDFQHEVSAYLNTKHKAYACSNTDIAGHFSDVVWHTETPVLRTAPVPMYLLSKYVRENNIKVVITGEGADEMLGGYDIFKEMIIRRFWAKYPGSKLRPLLLQRLYPYIPALSSQKGNMLKFFFGYKLNDTGSPVYSHLLRWNNSSKIASYLSPEIKSRLAGCDVVTSFLKTHEIELLNLGPLAKAQRLESTIFMSGYLLSSQGDRMGMANSVEGRYPFLDHRVAEYCAKIHPDLKIHGLNEKYILKKMMAGKIPDSVINRTKQPYRAPVAECFTGRNKPEYIKDLLSSNTLRSYGIFDPVNVTNLLHKLETSQPSELEGMIITALVSTQLLYHHFFTYKPGLTKRINNCRIIAETIMAS